MNLKSREKELSRIYRYNSSANIMFYRPNLLIHSKRVTRLTKEITKRLENIGLIFNKELAIELATIHDDAEIITGDIVATKKEEWNQKEKDIYEKRCKNAINILYKNYKSIEIKYDYKDLLELDIKRDSKEFFIVKYADRLDAHLECIHEICGGNKLFTKSFYNKKFGETNFFDFTHKRIIEDLNNICKSFNINLEEINKFDIFNLSQKFNINYEYNNSKNHTIKNIKEKKNYNLYNIWLKLHFRYGNKKDIQELYKIKNKEIVYL